MVGLFVGFGLLIGILFGFFGMGGSFLVTPALLVLGYPANVAVGSGLAFVFGTSVIGALKHRDHGQIDYKLGVRRSPERPPSRSQERVVSTETLGLAGSIISVTYVVLWAVSARSSPTRTSRWRWRRGDRPRCRGGRRRRRRHPGHRKEDSIVPHPADDIASRRRQRLPLDDTWRRVRYRPAFGLPRCRRRIHPYPALFYLIGVPSPRRRDRPLRDRLLGGLGASCTRWTVVSTSPSCSAAGRERLRGPCGFRCDEHRRRRRNLGDVGQCCSAAPSLSRSVNRQRLRYRRPELGQLVLILGPRSGQWCCRLRSITALREERQSSSPA